MPRVREILAVLDRIAPHRHALSFDKVGLQVGDLDQPVSRAVVAMDRSLGAVDHAIEKSAQLLLTHHPLIFNPIASVDSRSHEGRTLLKLAENRIAFIAAHTNWDAARGGINDTLARLLGLDKVKDFGEVAVVEKLKLVFYCPAAEVDVVIDSVSDAGAGVVGAYRRCAFASPGKGTFIGDETTSPAIGTAGQREDVDEIRVEMVLLKPAKGAVEKALRRAHPYEEPAYDFLVTAGSAEQPLGRIGDLATQTDLSGLIAQVDQTLGVRSWAWGELNRKIRKVAVVGGAADGEWMNAQRAGADVLLTGEVKQHVALEAAESGFAIIAAGHYQTEHPGSAALCDRMAREVADVEWILFTPEAGRHGRPL